MEEGVKSVERTFRIMEEVSLARDGIGITELATRLGMYKSTIHRVLSTLVSLGYVEQDHLTGRYRLGYKILQISSRLLNNLDLRRVALPFLQKLADKTNEVIHLVILDHGEVVYIDKVEGTETIRMHSQIGKRVPVHCTGVGKAILAYMPEDEMLQILRQNELVSHTPHTLDTEEKLFHDFTLIRERGYALDLEENELGIHCVAAPIWDYRGKVVAAISVTGPIMRMDQERLEYLSGLVREVGLDISEKLGYATCS